MNALAPYRLASDVVLVPASQLTAAFRRAAGARPGDYALAVPGGRRTAKLVNATLAGVLEQFRSPVRVPDAVLAAATVQGVPADALLRDASHLLADLIASGALVTGDDSTGEKSEPRLAPDTRFGEVTVRRCLQLMRDTEVHLVHDSADRPAVLKIGKIADAAGHASFQVEAEALRRLGGTPSPRLLASGTRDGMPYVVMEWRAGVPLHQALREMTPRQSGLRRAAQLAGSIVTAYERIHASGIVHGDVHGGNILIGPDGRVTILDFGLSRIDGFAASSRQRRGAAGFSLEPEYARSRIARRPAPPASPASDQFTVAAIAYSILTGTTYMDFALDEPRALAQIARPRPRPFQSVGARPWPEVEAVLGRALAREAVARYPTMAAFGAALREATASRSEAAVRTQHVVTRRRVSAHAEQVLQRHLPDYPSAAYLRSMPAPYGSVMHGAAGVAFAFLRLSELRNDPTHLARADAWVTLAMASSRRARAFYDGMELQPRAFDRGSLLHGLGGVIVVRGLVSHAMNDPVGLGRAMRSLAALLEQASDAFDFSMGRPGMLHGASTLLGLIRKPNDAARRRLHRATSHALRQVERTVLNSVEVSSERRAGGLGAAHGWAGVLLAICNAATVLGRPPIPTLRDRLIALGNAGFPDGRGKRWHWIGAGRDRSMPGWCNGSAGLTLLWLRAHKLFGDRQFASLAEESAWATWDDDDTTSNLCCGLAGRAYALAAVFRESGETAWAKRARTLAADAFRARTEAAMMSGSLFKGLTGLALAHAEMDEPQNARMPIIDPDLVCDVRVPVGPA